MILLHTQIMNSWIHTMVTVVLLISILTTTVSAWTDEYYTAAVYEHARWGNLSADSPRDIINTNLKAYWRAAAVAKSRGADIILFPEYGIFPPGHLRNDLDSFLEKIPDPKTIVSNPCEEKVLYNDRPILYSLSCMAKENSLVVVANIGDIQPCTGNPKCPEDGVLHLNANVAFDKNGTLITRYYKERLFFEGAMDLPIKVQDPTVKTEFGTFATFICFDIIFKKMADFARNCKIDGILFSCMWMNSSPFYTSTQHWRAFAIANNVTIMASNIQIPGYFAAGSGIFKGLEESTAHTLNPDGVSKLIVSRVPRSGHRLSAPNAIVFAMGNNNTEIWTRDGKDMPMQCSHSILGDSQNIQKDYRCWNENMTLYTLVKLREPRGHAEVCNNGLCCSVDYVADNMQETFYLGVYNGTYSGYSFNRYYWAEENCFLARCDDVNGSSCVSFPMKSKTIFHHIHLKANFTTDYIYPSVMSTSMRLTPLSQWAFSGPSIESPFGVIDFTNTDGQKILAIGMVARNYERDPPYER